MASPPPSSMREDVSGNLRRALVQTQIDVRAPLHDLAHELKARQTARPGRRRGFADIAGIRLSHPGDRVERRESRRRRSDRRPRRPARSRARSGRSAPPAATGSCPCHGRIERGVGRRLPGRFSRRCSGAFTSIPASSSARTTSMRPSRTAKKNGVNPESSVALMSAPASISARTTPRVLRRRPTSARSARAAHARRVWRRARAALSPPRRSRNAPPS